MTADRHDVDRLIAAHDLEEGKLAEQIVISQAEGVVTGARQAKLVEQQQAARRRLGAARGQLTRAQKNGNAEKIATARRRVDDADAEFARVSDANIAEMGQILTSRLDGLGAVMGQVGRAWAAGDAVTNALRRPPRPDPAGGERP